MHNARGRSRCFDCIHVVGIMYSSQLLARGARRIVLDQTGEHAGGDQRVRYGLETFGTLGVMPPHIVQEAITVREVRSLHWAEVCKWHASCVGRAGL